MRFFALLRRIVEGFARKMTKTTALVMLERSEPKATIKRVKHKVYFNVFQRAKWFRKTEPLLIISLRYGRYDKPGITKQEYLLLRQ